MRFAILAAALLLAAPGCRPARVSPDYKLQTESGQIDVARLERWAADLTGPDVFACWLESLAGVTNREAVLTAYAQAADSRMVQYLATQSRTALLGKLDSLKRRTNHHPYTEEQLNRALKVKERAELFRRRTPLQ